MLALLLLEGREAAADPIIKAGVATAFYYVLGNTWDAGTDTAGATNAGEAYIFTPLTTGGASMIEGTIDPAPYFSVGQTVLAKLAATARRDSNLSNLRRPNGPGETVRAGNSVFVGTTGSFALLDSPSALPSAASASFAYTMSPTAGSPALDTGTAAAPVNGDGEIKTGGSPVLTGTVGTPAIPSSMAVGGRTVSPFSGTHAATPRPEYTYAPLIAGPRPPRWRRDWPAALRAV